MRWLTARPIATSVAFFAPWKGLLSTAKALRGAGRYTRQTLSGAGSHAQ